MRAIDDRLRLVPLSCVLICLVGFGPIVPAAWAQPATPGQTFDIDLPAQPLAASLAALSRQTGIQILAAGELVAGKSAPAVSGRMTPRAALDRLLAGSELRAEPSGQGFVLQRATRSETAPAATPPPPATTQDVQLPEMQVKDQRERETAWGPVTGYVPSRSAVGTKTDSSLLETPQSISVVTKDQMIAQGAQSVPQALRYTSGIISEQRGTNSASLEYLFGRGFQMDQYLDGLKLPPVTLRFTIPSYDTYGLERIEVLHGPASVLYGQGTPAGIVNLVSKRPSSVPSYELQLQAGSFERFQGAFDLTGPLDKDGHFLYRLNGLGRTSSSQIQFDQQERLFLAPAFTWQPTRDTSLTILAHVKDDPKAGVYFLLPSDALFNNPNGSLSSSFNPGDHAFDRHRQESYSVGYSLDHRFNDVWSVYQATRFNYTEDYIRSLFPSFLQADGRTLERFAFFQDESVKVFTIDTQARAKFKTGPVAHTAVAGVDYQRIDYRDTGAFDFSVAVPTIDIFAPVYGQHYPVPVPTIREKFLSEQVGLYLQDQIKIGSFSALLGARRDWAWSTDEDLLAQTTETMSDGAWTWRVGLTYLFDSIGLAPYFSYATSFEPTSGVDFEGKAFVPTTGRQFELGVKYQPKNVRAMVTVAAFDIRQENVLTTDPDHLLFSIQTGQVRSRGIEVEGHANLTDGLGLVLAYTFLHQRVTESHDDDLRRRVAGMPTHAVSGWLDYTFQSGPLRGLGLGAGARYIGPTAGDFTNSFEVPSYVLVDAALHYDLGALHSSLKGGRLDLNVSNLLDKDYVSYCNGFCTVGLQRQILGAVTYRW